MTRLEQPNNLVDSSGNGTSKRKSRILGSLAFLAGLSFGGLANAASSTAKTISRLPQASFALNVGGASKTSPYFAAYYSPYSLLPYPFLYPGPFGLVPTADPTNTPNDLTTSSDLTSQLIGAFNGRRPIDLAEKDEEEVNVENNGADRRTESQTYADGNAEENVRT